MNWIETLLDRLAASPCCGYHRSSPVSTEPTALAALALMGHERAAAARPATDWLAQLQADDGSLGIRAGHDQPRWPTSLAVMAWIAEAARQMAVDHRCQRIRSAVAWILSVRGEILNHAPYLGHDTTLSAWPWVAGTHSWVEPSALHLLALQAAGQGDHPRAREAAKLLINRQLPSGGCNCGNTIVLGRELRPHVQPTGLALLALTGRPDQDGAIDRSLNWLQQHLSHDTTIASLAWGLLGLAAHGRMPRQGAAWLETACQRPDRPEPSPYKSALAALAALGEQSPLIQLARTPLGQLAEHA